MFGGTLLGGVFTLVCLFYKPTKIAEWYLLVVYCP